jgi:hypothetical protein
MLRLLLVLLAGSLLARRRLYLRCLSLSLFGRRLRGLGLFRILVGVFVMAPERDFCEAAWCSLLVLPLSALFPPAFAIVSALNSTRLTTRLKAVLIALLIKPPGFVNCDQLPVSRPSTQNRHMQRPICRL